MCNATDKKSSNIVTEDCDKNKLKIRVLLDTGALQCNYISQRIARRLGGSLFRGKATYKHCHKYKLVSCVNIIDSMCLMLNFVKLNKV